jgi:hypothetical protein
VRDILRLLVKTQKARRLYQAKNVIFERLQTELFSTLSAHLDEVGPVHLRVGEFQISQGDEVVYESHDRTDSFAFLLFRDGVRRLSFERGLEEKEFQDFLKCLDRVALLSNDQDDLVTLFWEADFKCIKYYAIDELTTESDGHKLRDQLASGSLAGQPSVTIPADAVSLELEQPVAHLPVEACRMEDQEIEALRAELVSEEEEPIGVALVELAIELTLLETSQEERTALANHLLSVVRRLLRDGRLDQVARALEHLESPNVVALGDSEHVRCLSEALVHLLSEPEQLRLFLEFVESDRSLEPWLITAYLAHLEPGTLPIRLEWMARMPLAAQRRAITESVRAAGELALAELEKHLPPQRNVSNEAFLREVLFMLTHMGEDNALPLVERLLGSSNLLTRRETIQGLGRFRSSRVEAVCLRLLADEDFEVRSTALDMLVRRGRPDLARLVLDHSLGAPNFDDRNLSEKRRIYAAVAKLGSNDVLDLFAEQLDSRQHRWFSQRKEREFCEAIVHGIRMVGTDTSRRRLRELADGGNRYVRAACLQELSGNDRA